MSLKLNSSGGGSVTLQEPATASALTLNLPAVNATVMTTGGGTFTQPITVSINNAFVAGSFYGFRQAFSGSDYSALSFTNAEQTVQYASLGYDTSNALIFNVGGSVGAGTERARFNASGNFLVGISVENYSSTANAVQILPATAIVCSKSSTGTVNQIVFNNGNGQVGYINTSGSSTIFATTSDYRLKNSVEPLSGGLSTVSALKPVTYKWNAGNAHGEGFIAHELAEHVPLAVSGEKDAVDENGNPIYQGVDYSKIVVHLVAAIQELKAQNDALEARVAALEGTPA